MISNNLQHQVQNWEVLEEDTQSDHKYIKVELFSVETPKEKKVTKKGEERILQELKQDTWLKTISSERIENIDRLDEIVNHLHDKINDLRVKHARYVKNSEPTKPWWSIDLEVERKMVRAKRRRYQRARGELRETFKRSYEEAQKITITT